MTDTDKRPLVWIDTETTSLRHDRRAWDVALIRRTPDGDVEHQWFIVADDLDLGGADLAALRIGRFHQRHPQYTGGGAEEEWALLDQVEELTRDAVLLGSHPAFDMDTLAPRMRANGVCPSWHYRPVDVPVLALGVLLGRGVQVPARDDGTLSTDDVCRAFGLDVSGYERHTALGDCRLFRDLYNVVQAETGVAT